MQDSLPRLSRARNEAQHHWLNTWQASVGAVLVIPTLFGLYSILLGADANWDLSNYHLYNPFALLNGKLEVDLAAAGLQGYFNPIVDLPAYWLNTTFPSRLAGFVLGALHGLLFPLILVIVRCILTDLADQDRYRFPMLVAVTGCLTPNFLSALGNGMGDTMTALPALGAICILLTSWNSLAGSNIRSFGQLLASGLLIGAAVGLKPTNGVFAVSACVSLLLTLSVRPVLRLRSSFLFGCGVLAGFALTGGYWMMRLWKAFGNPLFPQFGSVFPNQLASPISVADTRWLPHGAVEAALWPFLFTIDPHRVGELSLHQVVWPLAYVLILAWICATLVKVAQGHKLIAIDARAVFVMRFVSIGYLVWMCLFSVIRYTVAIEVLIPATIFVLLRQWLPYAKAKRCAIWLLAGATIYMILAGLPDWGHQRWTDPLYHAEVPLITSPERATVLMVPGPNERPQGWLATFFSPQLSFIGLENSFPASAKFAERAREIAQGRGGAIYVMTNAPYDKRALKTASYNAIATDLGLTQTMTACGMLRSVFKRLHVEAVVEDVADGPPRCKVGAHSESQVDIDARRREYITNMQQIIERSGFALVDGSCSTYPAGIGGAIQDYQLCKARLKPDRSPSDRADDALSRG